MASRDDSVRHRLAAALGISPDRLRHIPLDRIVIPAPAKDVAPADEPERVAKKNGSRAQ